MSYSDAKMFVKAFAGRDFPCAPSEARAENEYELGCALDHVEDLLREIESLRQQLARLASEEETIISELRQKIADAEAWTLESLYHDLILEAENVTLIEGDDFAKGREHAYKQAALMASRMAAEKRNAKS